MRADNGSKIFDAKVQWGLTRILRNCSRADDMLSLLSVVMLQQWLPRPCDVHGSWYPYGHERHGQLVCHPPPWLKRGAPAQDNLCGGCLHGVDVLRYDKGNLLWR